jgi:ankyrin repeat protein
MSKGSLDDFAAAIARNDLTFVTSLLSNREVDANARLPPPHHAPALVHAASLGLRDIVDVLLSCGARIDDVDVRRQSACHVASVGGHSDVMRVLLAHRPNLALRNTNGETALQLIVRADPRHKGDIALQLLRAGAPLDGADRRDLCRLAAASTSAAQTLMDRGVVVRDLRAEYGTTPLHVATLRGAELAVLGKLIECGVDVNARARDTEKWTCSSYAVIADRADALRFLLEAGATTGAANGTDNDVGEPLLHTSVVRNKYTCLILVLAAGADVTARDRHGRTACCLAVRVSSGPMMSFVHAMLAVGADLEAKDENGRTSRQWLTDSGTAVDPAQVETAFREIAKVRLDFVRRRALQVCIGLQSHGLDALQMCEILVHSCGPLATLVSFHHWWAIATTVKHFHQRC